MLFSFSKSNLWKHLWLKSQAPLIIFIFFNLAVSGATGYWTPKLISGFYQSLKDQTDFNYHLWSLGGLFLIEYLNRFLFQISTHRYIQLLLTDLRQNSFSLWLKAPFKRTGAKQDEFPMGEVLARLMNDTDAVREVVTSGSFAIFIEIIFILSCLVSFLQLNSTTGIALFVAEIFVCLLLIKGSKIMADVFMDVRKVTGQMARVVTDLSAGLRELFYSPHPKYASKRGEKIFEDFLDKQLRANIWDAGYYSAAESLYPILVALVILIIPYAHIVEIAILAALIDLIQKSIVPIKEVASKISVLQRAGTGLERISEFNSHFPAIESDGESFWELSVEKMNLKLNHFHYDQGFALEDINFELVKGQVLGILGESGCGKSTLLKLLSGQFYPYHGSIEIDQKHFNTENESELKKFSSYISLISQDSHVFTETLKFNLTLGYDGGFDEFWAVAQKKIPYLLKWGLLPEDKIEPKMLSMGQKQLVSGLRALFLKKPIILMDEISSGLDSELEAALKDLISFFSSRTITIIVTHRLETILRSDLLLLLDKGRVLAKGAPSELKAHPKFVDFMSHL